MPKLRNNLEVLESEASNTEAKVDAVFSSVLIAYVLTTYNIYINYKQIEVLLKCLRLPPNKEICSELMKKMNEFDDNALR